jgi:hypothetical protein
VLIDTSFKCSVLTYTLLLFHCAAEPVGELERHLHSHTASSGSSDSSSSGAFSSAATAAVAAALHRLSLNDTAPAAAPAPAAVAAVAADEKHVPIQRVFVTPLRVCMLPPEQEGLNRVLREYKQFSYRFLRVTFRYVYTVFHCALCVIRHAVMYAASWCWHTHACLCCMCMLLTLAQQ